MGFYWACSKNKRVLTMRNIVEKFSRQVILKRKLPKRFNSLPIYVSPESALKFWFRNFEKRDPTLLKMVDELVKPGEIVWDIGANVGVFSFAAAARAGKTGRVLSIEPDFFLLGLLNKSLSVQNDAEQEKAKVDILPVAISDKTGIVKFNIAARSRSTNFLENTEHGPETGGVRETISVMSVTLDWLLDYYPTPTVLKIDVENSENLVFQGAMKLLREIRPVIFFESSPDNKERREVVAAILKKNNYALYNAATEKDKRKPLDFPSYDTLAVPY